MGNSRTHLISEMTWSPTVSKPILILKWWLLIFQNSYDTHKDLNQHPRRTSIVIKPSAINVYVARLTRWNYNQVAASSQAFASLHFIASVLCASSCATTQFYRNFLLLRFINKHVFIHNLSFFSSICFIVYFFPSQFATLFSTHL